mmetsp:Transcript_11372/g.36330  ORF Transcript_11372/g.36330 Transcript_11372/m.36330 type:complete len:214 (+) Transcript_11372:157-798(+)
MSDNNSRSAASSSTSKRKRALTVWMSSGTISPMPASSMSVSRLRMRLAPLRKMLYAWQQSRRKVRSPSEPSPPMPTSISFVSRIGGGFHFGSRPKMYPKSTWNRWPVGLSMMLSRCLSPMPSRYVITAYPAHDRTNTSSTCGSTAPPGAGPPGRFRRKKFWMSPTADMGTASDTNSTKPSLALVASTRYGLRCRSRFTCFSIRSMIRIICRIS